MKDIPINLASYIDHTLLKPEANEEQIKKLCEEARKYVFASVCINPHFVSLCAKLLQGSPVKVCTVIGFPLGATTTETKVFETKKAILDGAHEIDMVINVGAIKSKDYSKVEDDIRQVVRACEGKILKVILETALLTNEEKVIACQLSVKAGADFVKTSTGFGPGGATEEDIALMRSTVGPNLGVKASGGIRDTLGTLTMLKAGATRVGASASVAIVNNSAADKNSKY
ncbi:MAG: deoxyribose-phosphate aldolase [Cyanobacteriota bacterium]